MALLCFVLISKPLTPTTRFIIHLHCVSWSSLIRLRIAPRNNQKVAQPEPRECERNMAEHCEAWRSTCSEPPTNWRN